jgi:hypothetical protein
MERFVSTVRHRHKNFLQKAAEKATNESVVFTRVRIESAASKVRSRKVITYST